MKTIIASIATLLVATTMIASPIQEIPVKDIDGKATSLKAFEGKVVLIVNVASKCGYTPQYKGLEEVYRRNKDKGLAVLGFPCDQFGH